MKNTNKKSFYAGIDLGGTKILTVIEDEERNVLAKTKIPTEATLGVCIVMDNIVKSLEISCKEIDILPN